MDNNSLKIISHTAVPVIKLTTVGYAPSSAPSTAFAAATAAAAAAAAATSATIPTNATAAVASPTDDSVGHTSSSSAPIGEESPGLGQSASTKASDVDGIGCGNARETTCAPGKEDQDNITRDEVAASSKSTGAAAAATATVVAREGERKPGGQGNGELIPSAVVSPVPKTLPLPPPHPAREAKEEGRKDVVPQDLRNGATSRGVVIDRNRSQEHGHGHDHEGVRASGLVGGGVVGSSGGGAGIVDPVGLPRVLVDVSFEGQGHNGQAANRLVKDLVDGFPALRPLALLLKQVCFCVFSLRSYSTSGINRVLFLSLNHTLLVALRCTFAVTLLGRGC